MGRIERIVLFSAIWFLAICSLGWDTGPLVKVKDSQTLIVGDTEILLPAELTAWKRDDGAIQLQAVEVQHWRPEEVCPNKATQKMVGIDSYGQAICENESGAPAK